MIWLLPSALAIAGIGAATVVALHFIARSRPLAEPLPTARFIPERPVHARTRSVALTDLLLLLLRVAAVLAIGAGLAAPVFESANGRVARVVVVDRSRAVASPAEARDSAVALLRSGDALVLFDSSARMANVKALDSVAAPDVRGSLSAALVAATRAAVTLSAQSDSVEMIVISPFSTEEVNEATPRIRAAWPGRIRLVPVRAVVRQVQPLKVRPTSGGESDAVVAGLAVAGVMMPSGTIRIVRSHLTPADSAWARDSGHVLIHWPVADSIPSWPKRGVIDAIGGVMSAGGGTMIGRFPRLWTVSGKPLARWADGELAATEHEEGAGCIRDVAILVDQASDLTLRAPFARFVAPLLAPCGGYQRTRPVDASTLAGLSGSGKLATAAALRDLADETSRWTSWLLALGALLLIAELALRRTTRSAA